MTKTTRPILVVAGALALTLAAVLAAGSTQWTSDRDHDMKSFKKEDIVKTLKFSDTGKPGELIVDNVFGPITVEGYTGKDVLLEARKIVYARDEVRAKKAEDEVKLDITEKGNTVEAYVDGPFRETDAEGRTGGIHMHRDPGYRVYYGFTLKVPVRTNLVLATVLDGDVEVRGVEGAFDVRNVNGKVRLVDAAGSGDAQTVNGGVTVLFRRPPDGPCLFKTINGDVEARFPRSAVGRLPGQDDARRSLFGFRRHFSAEGGADPRRASGEGRQVRLRSDGFYGVRTGKGGPEIKLETLNGDILIAKRSKSTS